MYDVLLSILQKLRLKKVPHWTSSLLERRGCDGLDAAAVDVAVHTLVVLKHLPAALPQRHRGGEGAAQLGRLSF